MADLINATDSLNTGRFKINAIIEDASAAVIAAESASATAGEAKTTANSVQTQLDTIILVDGASDAEVVQSRVDKDGKLYATLKERLDSSDAQLADIVSINFVTDCGGVPDGVTNNYEAFVELSRQVQALGQNVRVLFPMGEYQYKPILSGPDTWRNLVQLVDVKNIHFLGYGATIRQIKDPTWTAGYTPTGLSEQESPVQFRGSFYGACDNITLEGLSIIGDRVPYSADSGGDGNCIGIYLRGVTNARLINLNVSGWGTDGVTIGRNYGDTHKSRNIYLANLVCDANVRQGLSVTGADNVTIKDSTFSNTNGGSFGHGIDLEPNTGLQYNIRIINCYFYNNQRGAFNVMRTHHVILSDCFVEELNTTGAIYVGGLTGESTYNIVIKDSTIITNKAALYMQGINVQKFVMDNCTIETKNQPNDRATVRVNFSNVANTNDDITIKNCRFNGTGGVLVNIQGRFRFEGNRMTVSKMDSSTGDIFGFNVEADGYILNNEIILNSDVTSTGVFVVRKGIVEGNRFISHAGAVFTIRDNRTSPMIETKIGRNIFSTYFFYSGEHAELHVTKEGVIVENNSQGRLVHGGYRRTVSGANAQLGDYTYRYDGPVGGGMLYRCITAGTPGTWETLLNRL